MELHGIQRLDYEWHDSWLQGYSDWCGGKVLSRGSIHKLEEYAFLANLACLVLQLWDTQCGSLIDTVFLAIMEGFAL